MLELEHSLSRTFASHCASASRARELKISKMIKCIVVQNKRRRWLWYSSHECESKQGFTKEHPVRRVRVVMRSRGLISIAVSKDTKLPIAMRRTNDADDTVDDTGNRRLMNKCTIGLTSNLKSEVE
eukprot:scaffold38938_cov205-Skeletonema_dohrnii-CCMP3373.AAC.2